MNHERQIYRSSKINEWRLIHVPIPGLRVKEFIGKQDGLQKQVEEGPKSIPKRLVLFSMRTNNHEFQRDSHVYFN